MTATKARNLKSGFGASIQQKPCAPARAIPGGTLSHERLPSLPNVESSPRAAMPVAVLLFLLPALLPAQTVPVSTAGLVGITTGVPPTYTGTYVLQQTEYGFFWLDTSVPSAGHVQAVSKCVGGFPTSDTGIYVLADCNSITNISASGTLSVVRMTSGQCGAQSIGCGGLRDDGHWRFTFGLGTWDYRGDLGEIPDSTQTADPLGRTWQIRPTDSTYRNFAWTVIGGGVPPTATSTPTPAFTPTPTPTPTPGPGFRATNLSSQLRGDSVNYYGDKWQLQDISNPSPTHGPTGTSTTTGHLSRTRVELRASRAPSPATFPATPVARRKGTSDTGSLCRQSLGQTDPPSTNSYQFALLSSVSASPLASGPLQVVCPQAGIVGYTGFTGTCAKSGGTLTVVTGGNADASPSNGNLQDAVFDWSFTGGPPIHVGTKIAPVPPGTTGFTLTITFPGAYTATASGSVTIVPSVPRVGVFLDAAGTQPPFIFGGAYQLSTGTTYYLKDTEDVPPPSAQFFLTTGSGPTPARFGDGLQHVGVDPDLRLHCRLLGQSHRRRDLESECRGLHLRCGTAADTDAGADADTASRRFAVGHCDGPVVGLERRRALLHGERERRHAGRTRTPGTAPTFRFSRASAPAARRRPAPTRPPAPIRSRRRSPTRSGRPPRAPATPSRSWVCRRRRVSYAIAGPTLSFNPSTGDTARATVRPSRSRQTRRTPPVTPGTSETGRPRRPSPPSKTYSAGGSYSVHLTVTGDETNTSGASSVTIPLSITGPPPPSTAYTVSGATQTGADTYTAEAGRAHHVHGQRDASVGLRLGLRGRDFGDRQVGHQDLQRGGRAHGAPDRDGRRHEHRGHGQRGHRHGRHAADASGP